MDVNFITDSLKDSLCFLSFVMNWYGVQAVSPWNKRPTSYFLFG